jgi:putative transcriptional regulator
MPSKIPHTDKPLSPQALAAFEASRDFHADLLLSIAQMKAGKTTPVIATATVARQKIGLSQAQFAKLLGVSIRSLQSWEQGRKQPSGAARTLLAIASQNPQALLAVTHH